MGSNMKMKYTTEEFPCNACGEVLFSQSGSSNDQKNMHRRQDLNQQSLASHKGNTSCGNTHKRDRAFAANFVDLNHPPACFSQPTYEKLHDGLFLDAKERSCRLRLSDHNASLEAV